MNTRLKENGVWLVCLGWLVLLAFNASPPGCVCVRDEQGKPILWACRFAGATLGPALILLFGMLPVLTLP
jgi:hypothetical protein